jgi:DNA-binding LytR/AlgR family response regulator
MLQESVARQGRRLQRLPVRNRNRILIIGVEQITSLRVDHGLVFVSTAEGEYRTNYTNLGQIADQLDEEVFLRVHRQNIVNLNHIREINAFDNSTARLTLSCGRQVSVSRTQMKRLRQSLGL